MSCVSGLSLLIWRVICKHGNRSIACETATEKLLSAISTKLILWETGRTQSRSRDAHLHILLFPPSSFVFSLFPFLLSPLTPFVLFFLVFYIFCVCVYVRIYVCAYVATFPPLKRRLLITIRPTCAGQWRNWVSTHLNIKYVPDKKTNEMKKIRNI